MRVALVALAGWALAYLTSFAVFSWRNRERLAAVGGALLGLAAFAVTLMVALSQEFEL